MEEHELGPLGAAGSRSSVEERVSASERANPEVRRIGTGGEEAVGARGRAGDDVVAMSVVGACEVRG